ncbi:MFS transporter [Roseomonas sp. CCTCC AB2023176]|uniref:MFS transporter n=1 Tax=Roseomonas sp. CCTCC AB2023176 TaxID=3342640 RepID=UPI0035D8C1FF
MLLYGFSGFASSLASRTLDPVLPELATEFAVTVETVALVASAFALPYALIQPVLGPVGDGLGKRRVILVATFLTALCLLGCALAPNVEGLFLARALAGAAAGGIFPLTIATFGDQVPMARRQVALSRVLAMSIAGQIAGGVISGAVSGHVGWRAVQAAGAAVQLLAAFVLWRDLRARPDGPPGRVDLAGSLRRYAEIARIPQARRLWGAVAAEGVLVFGLFPYVAALIVRWGIGSAPEAGLALSAFGAAGIAYAALSGVLLRRLGLTRMLAVAGVLGLAGDAGLRGDGLARPRPARGDRGADRRHVRPRPRLLRHAQLDPDGGDGRGAEGPGIGGGDARFLLLPRPVRRAGALRGRAGRGGGPADPRRGGRRDAGPGSLAVADHAPPGVSTGRAGRGPDRTKHERHRANTPGDQGLGPSRANESLTVPPRSAHTRPGPATRRRTTSGFACRSRRRPAAAAASTDPGRRATLGR